MDAADYVLSRFAPGERPVIEDAIAATAQGVLVWVREGIDVCMNRVNAGPEKEKPKKDKPARPTADRRKRNSGTSHVPRQDGQVENDCPRDRV